VQKKADTCTAVLHQVSSQSTESKGSGVRSKLVACGPPGHGRKFKDQKIKNGIELAFKKGRLEGNAGAETCREWVEGRQNSDAPRDGIRVFSARMGHGQ
jgi:hypothetical protein